MRQEIPTSFGDGRFIVEREIGRGGMGVVYEAFDEERDMPVALKTLLHMDADSLYYFKREFRSLHDIVHPNLCSFMELIQDDKSWFLTMELIKGVDFLSYVKSPDNGFDEERLRKSLEGLCAGLNALHAAGKVHRDIKPSNVMITDDDRVVLLDFGLITDKEIQRQTELGSIVGTAAYMSPEQAESSALGPEADWYSVGVMLFEAMTGKLPFDGQPLKIILNKQMSDPVRPGEIKFGLPDDLENLCFDLLSRDPKTRPNPVDFLNVMDAYSATGTHSYVTNVTEFTQGEIFVGRKEELKLLKESLKKVAEGSFETVIVEGVSGVGKSALVDRFTSDIFSEDDSIVVLNGRCYEYESAPFKAFDGIIDSLIRQLRNFTADEYFDIEPRHPELLVRLFPALRRSDFFANIPKTKIEIADPYEVQRRSFEAFGELLSKIAKRRTLVVVIDDMQWADSDSISLLKQLVTEDDAPSILLALLSRYTKESQESSWDWENVITKNTIKLHLKPLSMSESTELTRIFISREHESIGVDPELIASEADGHPMYIGELVYHLMANREDDWHSLRLDDAIWRRVSLLPEAAIEILKIICVNGAQMNREHVKILAATQSEDFQKYISLLRANRFIKSRKVGRGHVVEPYHDRVRESVLKKIGNTEEALTIHVGIGRFYLGIYTEEEIKENIFTVVRHLRAGQDLIVNSAEKMRLAELYILAGKISKETAAFVSSLVFFQESIKLYSHEGWENDYKTVFDLYCSAAESAYITGNYLLAKEYVVVTEKRAKSIYDIARIYETLVLSLNAEGKPQRAIEAAIRMIRKLGIYLPFRISKLYVLVKIVLTKTALLGKTEDKIASLPPNNLKNITSAFRLMINTAAIAFFHNPLVNTALALKMIELSLKYGIDTASSNAFLAWGFINVAFLRNYQDAAKYGKISLDIQERIDGDNWSPFTLFTYAGFIQHWSAHIRTTLPNFLKCHQQAYKTGNMAVVSFSGTAYCYHSFHAGIKLASVSEALEHFVEELEDKQKGALYLGNRILHRTIMNLVGLTDNPVRINHILMVEADTDSQKNCKELKNYLSNYHFYHLVLYVLFGSYNKAYIAASELKNYPDYMAGTYRLAVLPYYESIACLNCYNNTVNLTKHQLLRRVSKNQRKYKKIAKASPENHAHKYTLVEAERARVKRKYKKAPALYDQAIAGAIEQEFTQDAALACEFAADFYREIGDEGKTMAYAKDALGHYEKWGAFAKVEHVKEKFRIE